MDTKRLGRTGLEVTQLGFGLSRFVGRYRTDGKDAPNSGRVLEAALDGGINFLDTAASYGNTEALIGKTIAHRRDEYFLATKFPGASNGMEIAESIDRSLKRMKTDHLDVFQLHSPEPNTDLLTLDRDEIVDAMLRAKEAGKTRFLGYSGDNEAAQWAVNSGVFDTLQTTFNIVDQQARKSLFAEAKARDMGIIIKRVRAMGLWGKGGDADDKYLRRSNDYFDYVERVQEMGKAGPVPGAPGDSNALAHGFVFAHPDVDTVLVGTTNVSHLLSDIKLVESGVSITAEAVDELHRRYDEHGWRQVT